MQGRVCAHCVLGARVPVGGVQREKTSVSGWLQGGLGQENWCEDDELRPCFTMGSADLFLFLNS